MDIIIKPEWDLFDKNGKEISYLEVTDKYKLEEYLDKVREQSAEYRKINREAILVNHPKKFDHAILVDFKDNDYCCIFENIFENHINNEFSFFLDNILYGFDNEDTEKSFDSFFEHFEEKLKAWFVIEYLADCIDGHFDLKVEDILKEEAYPYQDYIFENIYIYIGTLEGMKSVIKERYGSIENTNGEVVLAYIEDNHVKNTL